MNLLLVDAAEVTDGRVVLADRRAAHLRDVLGVEVGTRIRAGVLGGGTGTAEVVAIERDRFTLALTVDDAPPRIMPIELVLAMPRPKVLTRVLEAAASFGVARIALTNAWRVDKSYLDSPRLDADAIAAAVRLGAEQGGTTHLPEVAQHRRLMELLERWPPSSGSGAPRLVAHPGGVPIEQAYRGGAAVLAIGPEGGWIAREVETFVARGFTPVALGAPILRVETAVAAALGQLALLARLPMTIT